MNSLIHTFMAQPSERSEGSIERHSISVNVTTDGNGNIIDMDHDGVKLSISRQNERAVAFLWNRVPYVIKKEELSWLTAGKSTPMTALEYRRTQNPAPVAAVRDTVPEESSAPVAAAVTVAVEEPAPEASAPVVAAPVVPAAAPAAAIKKRAPLASPVAVPAPDAPVAPIHTTAAYDALAFGADATASASAPLKGVGVPPPMPPEDFDDVEIEDVVEDEEPAPSAAPDLPAVPDIAPTSVERVEAPAIRALNLNAVTYQTIVEQKPERIALKCASDGSSPKISAGLVSKGVFFYIGLDSHVHIVLDRISGPTYKSAKVFGDFVSNSDGQIEEFSKISDGVVGDVPPPVPTPAVVPSPSPRPLPAPAPTQSPVPAPEPAPVPSPSPVPAPKPAPMPVPPPAPAPVPPIEPVPEPAAAEPAPFPEATGPTGGEDAVPWELPDMRSKGAKVVDGAVDLGKRAVPKSPTGRLLAAAGLAAVIGGGTALLMSKKDTVGKPEKPSPTAPATTAPAPATSAPVAPATEAPAPATEAPAPVTAAPAPATEAPAPATEAPEVAKPIETKCFANAGSMHCFKDNQRFELTNPTWDDDAPENVDFAGTVQFTLNGIVYSGHLTVPKKANPNEVPQFIPVTFTANPE